MKIGILTQPLHSNYGGILQNFALQQVLKKMGHEPCTINTQFKNTSAKIKFFSIIKRLILRVFYNKPIVIRAWTTVSENNIILYNMNDFISQNICLSEQKITSILPSSLDKYCFDAYIVGSDQVWRPQYSPNLSNYFFDFLADDKKTIKVAYSASFGVDEWEYTDDETKNASLLINKFDAVSVRESTAVKLCKDYLHIDAEQMIDPTLLLTKEDYIELFSLDTKTANNSSLTVYILDISPEKDEVVNTVANALKLIPQRIMPANKFSEVGRKQIKKTIYQPVSKWIRSFMVSDYVVTDSFHGTVFSIIFNKPFIAIGNAGRGITRFTSLLEMLGLEKRLIFSPQELTSEMIHLPIDYTKVNVLIKNEQQRAVKFLKKALKV